MKIAPKLVLAASAIAITGTLSLLGGPSQAATAQQCPGGLGKTEVGGDLTSVYTGLAPGTQVCIKVGNVITTVVVDANGFISNTTIKNQNQVLQGISNYVWYTTPTTTTVAPTTTTTVAPTTTTTTVAPTTTTTQPYETTTTIVS